MKQHTRHTLHLNPEESSAALRETVDLETFGNGRIEMTMTGVDIVPGDKMAGLSFNIEEAQAIRNLLSQAIKCAMDAR